MKAVLPNLELLEYKTQEMISSDSFLSNEIRQYFKSSKFIVIDLSCKVFKQIWGSTCTAFDICDNGSFAVSGSAMTPAYTVVFEEPITSTYFVFVDNRFCYKVHNPSDEFFEDLKNCNLVSLSEAKERY